MKLSSESVIYQSANNYPMSAEEGQADQRRRLLRRKSAFSVLHATMSAILGTASLMLIARNLGAEVLGTIGFAISLFGIISFLSDFGIGSVHSRILSESDNPARAIGAYAIIRLSSLGLMILVGVAIFGLWNQEIISGAMGVTAEATSTLFIFLAYYVLLGVSQIASHTFEARNNVVKSQSPEILDLLIRAGLIVVIVTTPLAGMGQSVIYIAYAYLLGALGCMIVSLLLFRHVRIEIPDKLMLRRYFAGLSPIVIVSGAIALMSFIDKLFVGYFWGAHELGLYFGAQKLMIFVTTFALGVAILILPSITTYKARKDPLATWELVSFAERYVSAVIFPAAAFYIVLSPQILKSFLGSEFVVASNMMTVLVISSIFASFVFPLRAILAAENEARTIFYIQMISVGVSILLLLMLVPRSIFGVEAFGLGALGAAFAILGGSLISFIGTRWMAWREIRALPSYRSLIHMACASVMAAVVYVVERFVISASYLWEIILLALIASAVYTLLIRLAGELELQDLRYFASLLKPRENIRYAAKELLGK